MPEPDQYNCGFCKEVVQGFDEEYSSKTFKHPCDQCALAILLEKYPEFIKAMREHSRSLERFIQFAPTQKRY